VFLVSHDRGFLDNVVTQVIAADGDGAWKEYVGGYAEWVRQRPAPRGRRRCGPRPPGRPPLRRPGRDGTARAGAAADAAAGTGGVPARRSKLSYRDARELEQLPARVEALEAEQAALEEQLADPATYQPGAADVAALAARREAIENELLECLERWETLERGAG
jgi:ATP-binding cassette subfamily F protein uup